MKKNYIFYKKNGFCVLNLFNKKDIESIKKEISLKLNNLLKSKKIKFNLKNLDEYHKIILQKQIHSKLMSPSTRYTKLPRTMLKKINNKQINYILDKEWGHKDKAVTWIGLLKKKELKIDHTGFRISRPEQLKKKNIKDVAGVHIDLYTGGERLEFDDLVTLWVPIIGFTKKYTLNLYSKTHKLNHGKNFIKSIKISFVCKPKYYKKFKSFRPALKPGQAILFHPNLMHGGSTNKGDNTRVSIDLRLLNKRKNPAYKRIFN
jgi:hypothetical protein